MPLTDTASIITDCGLPSDIEVTKLQAAIKKAEIVMRNKIGDTQYDLFVATPNENARIAESHMSLFFAMPFLNLRVTNKGGFVKSVGFNETRQDIMSHSELQKYRNELRAHASILIEPWLVADTTGETAQAGTMSFFSVGAPEE